jgi:flagellar basal-body rod protein FlgF
VRSAQISSMTGFSRQEKRFDTIANNLSNSQTVGFKRDLPVFERIMSQTRGHYRNETNDSAFTVFQQGDIQKTGNELGLAIEGEGFFKVQTPRGIRYTRNGNFTLNKDNKLITQDGFPVLGRQGEINLNGKNIQITPDGAVKVDGNEVGQMELVTFADIHSLRKEGYNLFQADETMEEVKANPTQIHQGAVEASNVNPLEEMVRLMDCLRSYESSTKVIQAQDELDGKAVNEIGRV